MDAPDQATPGHSRTMGAATPPPQAIVIFGGTGDLTRRKLIPAVARLARHKRLSPNFAVVGVARTPMTDDEFRHTALGDNGADLPQLAEPLA